MLVVDILKDGVHPGLDGVRVEKRAEGLGLVGCYCGRKDKIETKYSLYIVHT